MKAHRNRFRVWVKHDMAIGRNDEIEIGWLRPQCEWVTLDDNGQDIIWGWVEREESMLIGRDADVEFSAGRSDANGVEVFEGDIIEAPHDYGPAGFKTERMLVCWDNLRGYQWGYWQVMKMVVIGNIHEDAHLLEENA